MSELWFSEYYFQVFFMRKDHKLSLSLKGKDDLVRKLFYSPRLPVDWK